MRTLEQLLNDERLRLERELQRIKVILWYAIKSSGGKVKIPISIVASTREDEMELLRYEDPTDKAIIIEARRK